MNDAQKVVIRPDQDLETQLATVDPNSDLDVWIEKPSGRGPCVHLGKVQRGQVCDVYPDAPHYHFLPPTDRRVRHFVDPSDGDPTAVIRELLAETRSLRTCANSTRRSVDAVLTSASA